MMTALECRVKADEMSNRAACCNSAEKRVAFAGIAAAWCTTAALASCQEQWEAADPAQFVAEPSSANRRRSNQTRSRAAIALAKPR